MKRLTVIVIFVCALGAPAAADGAHPGWPGPKDRCPPKTQRIDGGCWRYHPGAP